MPLNEVQTRAWELIQADPEAFRILQGQVHRLDPDGKIVPKTALPDVQLETKVEAQTKPLLEKITKLEEDLRKKQETDDNLYQRDFMRRKYGMKDDAIDELAKWMKEDGDGNIYQSYEAAHKYRLAMKQPIIPNAAGSPQRNPMTGRGVRDETQEPWRADIAKRRKESANPRQQDRAKARETWASTLQELRNKGS